MSKPKTKIPDFFSEPILANIRAPDGANRADTLAKIESGELEFIDVPAKVYRTGTNTNFYSFRPEELSGFAASFVGQPFLRNHDTWDIAARDGTITESKLEGEYFIQTLRLTTRAGMTAYLEGQIDRFSIGWYQDKILCSVCNLDYFSCNHMRGKEYQNAAGQTVTCNLIFTNPRGKETSAVNVPAVIDGTGLLAELEALKPEGEDQMFKIPKPQFEADKGAGAGQPVVTPSSVADLTSQLREGLEAMRITNDDAQRNAALQEQLAIGNQVLVDQCSFLLTSGLQTSRLPEVTQARLRKQFDGKVFKLTDLQTAIDEARAEVSTLTAGQNISGPGRNQISGMFGADQEFRAALDDLLGAERHHDMVGKKVRRLSGIREAYLLGTGDIDFHGGFDPLNALQFMLGGTATFPGIVKDSLNKVLIAAWKRYGEAGYDWWKNIVTVEHFETMNTPDWVRTGTIGSLPTIAEGIDYSELPIGDNVETSTWYKYGGYIELTLEAILRDNINAFKKMPNEVALGALRNISEQVAAIFTSNSAAGPTLADGGALFNATAVTTSGGHANLLTTALGTDYTAWKAVSNAMFKQAMLIAGTTYGTGKRQAIRPKFCLVPADLWDAACDLFVTRQNSLDNKNVENRYFGQVYPICVPEWTDTNDWAAVIDPNILPGIMIGEMFGLIPDIFVAGGEQNGAMFANDSSRIKVRQFLTVGVADWRALHKENV